MATTDTKNPPAQDPGAKPAEPPPIAPMGPGGPHPEDQKTWPHLQSRYATEVVAAQGDPVKLDDIAKKTWGPPAGAEPAAKKLNG